MTKTQRSTNALSLGFLILLIFVLLPFGLIVLNSFKTLSPSFNPKAQC